MRNAIDTRHDEGDATRRSSHRISTAWSLVSAAILVIAAAVAGCGSTSKRDAQIERPTRIGKAPSAETGSGPRTRRGGGYYLDDGPGDSPPADLESIPEAVPQWEPLHRGTMRPYTVLGQNFTPMTELQPYKARGVATWYGRRYHGKQTSSGEIYDMYGMTAAHPVLPIPSYVRVTNVATGKSVVVRVNDRGPFIDNRLIDLSYTAAHRIGVLGGGHAVVDVESIIPEGTLAGSSTANAASRARTAAARAAAAAQSTPIVAAQSSASAPAFEPSPQIDPIVAIAAAAAVTAPVPIALAEPESVPSKPDSSTPATGGGVYLQLGAFGSRENAESYLAQAKVQVEGIAQRLHLVLRDGMYRVHTGPYASAGEARLAAERIALALALGARPVVVTR